MIQALEQNQSQDFNTLLDRSLATYASNEPSFGLEDRVIARVTSEAAPSNGNLLGHKSAWVWLSALAAVTIAAVFLLYPHGQQQSQPHPQLNFAKTQPSLSPETHADLQRPQTPHTVRAALPSHVNSQPAKTASQATTQPVYGQTQPTKDDLLMAKLVSHSPFLAAELAKTPVTSTTPISSSIIPNQPIAVAAIQMNEITVAPVEVAEIH